MSNSPLSEMHGSLFKAFVTWHRQDLQVCVGVNSLGSRVSQDPGGVQQIEYTGIFMQRF